MAYRLHQIEVLDVSLWRLIRVPVIERHLAMRHGRGRSNQNRVPLRRIPSVAASIARSICHLSRLGRRQYLVLGFPRRTFEEGEWVDPFSDPLIDLLGPDKTICLEKPFGGEHSRPPKTRDIIYYDWVTALTLVASSMAFFVPLIVFRRQISELAHRVHRMTGIPSRGTGRMAAKAIVRFWLERALARRLLSVVRPRAMLLTIRRHHHPLIHVCKIRGIPVYELQHGAIAEGGYKASTPYDSKFDPDVFLTFGEYWNKAEWGLPVGSVKTIGFKYLVDRRAGLAGRFTVRGKKVMLVSQPHLSRVLEPAYSWIVEHFPAVEFILKLHPQDVGRWWERYPCGKKDNVKVQAEASPDLYSLFAECSCVIGYDSTVLFEASFFGLVTGILNEDGTNRCAALEFAGRYNFFEVRDLEQVGQLLRVMPEPLDRDDHPFFAEFDEDRFLQLMRDKDAVR